MVWEGDNTVYSVSLSVGGVDTVRAANFAISPNGDLSLYDSNGGVQAFAAGRWTGVRRIS